MPGTVIRTDPRPGVALLTLSHPRRLNAMDHELLTALHAELDRLAGDLATRVVILTGAGRGFCAGLDLVTGTAVPGTEYLGRPQRGMAIQQLIASLVPKLRDLPQPVIAAVNGPAAGAASRWPSHPTSASHPDRPGSTWPS